MDSESAGPARAAAGEVLVPRKAFLREWWERLRPHALEIGFDVGWTLLRLAGELVVSLFLLLCSWIFHWAGERLFQGASPYGQKIFDGLHLGGSALALGLFTGLFLREVWRFSQRHGGGGGS
jgi:hypothetical protein